MTQVATPPRDTPLGANIAHICKRRDAAGGELLKDG